MVDMLIYYMFAVWPYRHFVENSQNRLQSMGEKIALQLVEPSIDPSNK